MFIDYFKKCIYYLGYGLANCILIEGQNNAILIDTMESLEAAKDVLNAFQTIITKKPIIAIILTHFHPDHTMGLDIFTEKFPRAEIYSHETLKDYFRQLLNIRVPTTHKRGAFQFGSYLGDEEHENSGIGFKLR